MLDFELVKSFHKILWWNLAKSFVSKDNLHVYRICYFQVKFFWDML